MTIPGKLEITIKINTLPESQTADNGWKSFTVDCEGRLISITVRPKMWKKLEEAHEKFPQWVASIGGQMGVTTKQGLVLEKPNIQVFERKAKGASTSEQSNGQLAQKQKSVFPDPFARPAKPASEKTDRTA